MSVISALKTGVTNHIKNINGWKTSRKIVVFSVDDYGNVRLDSKKAAENLEKAGLKPASRFDRYDTLETEDDLIQLYEVLSSVKDIHGNAAVFTAFALPANINYEKIIAEGYSSYQYELLPETLSKLPGYNGVWRLWQEGMAKRLLIPQSHGREHLNLKVFNELLEKKDPQLITLLQNRSYTSVNFKKYPTISYTAALEFDKFEENKAFAQVLDEGLDAFEKVFGYRATHFNPPGGREHPVVHEILKKNGIKFIDTPFDKKEHQGDGVYKRRINYMGKKNELGQTFLIRNGVFEPTEKKGYDWVDYTLKQIDAAFFWNKPAVISSHRVNFCGHIDPENRRKGLEALRQLLHKIVKKYPEVEFMAAHELGELIASDSK